MIRLEVSLRFKRKYSRRVQSRNAGAFQYPIARKSRRGRIVRWIMRHGVGVKSESGRYFYAFDLDRLEQAAGIRGRKLHDYFRCLHNLNAFGYQIRPQGESFLELPYQIPASGIFRD